MKLFAALVLLPTLANANPYFRLIDPAHPQPVFGAALDPKALWNTEAQSLIPAITHSPKDGCLLPTIVCEDWTPIAVGASMNAGKITFAAAPLANVLPWMLYPLPDKWKQAAPSTSVTFSAGPEWLYKQVTNKGYFRVFTGLALHF